MHAYLPIVLFIVIPALAGILSRSRQQFVSSSSMFASIVIAYTLSTLALKGPVEDVDFIFEMGIVLWCLLWILFCLVYYCVLARFVSTFFGDREAK